MPEYTLNSYEADRAYLHSHLKDAPNQKSEKVCKDLVRSLTQSDF